MITTRSLRAFAGARLALGCAAAALALLYSAAPGKAIVVSVAGQRYGVTPVDDARGEAFARAVAPGIARPAPGRSEARPFDEFGPVEYHGGPVMHGNTTHVVYWDPHGEFKSTTKSIISNFFTDVAHDSGLGTNVFGVDAQYTDDESGNAAYASTFSGALVDADAYPENGCFVPEENDFGPQYTLCLTDEQLRHELRTYINRNSLPKGSTQLYFLLLPHSVVTCLPETEEGLPCSNNFFCAYHSWIEAPVESEEIIYADIPYTLLDSGFAKECQDDGNNSNIQQPNPDNEGGSNSETRFADVALKYVSHEFSESITDPNADAWFENAHGQEIGDKCNAFPQTTKEEKEPGFDKNAFKPILGGTAGEENLYDQSIDGGHFYVQSEWDNVAKACRMEPLPVTSASFTTVTSSPVQGSPVEFKGTATDPYGHLELSWTFGDGHGGSGEKPSHTYAAAGEYTVAMTARDALTGATAAPVKHTIVVDELPTASFTLAPPAARIGETVTFNGSESEDPDGSITAYKWEFGDGKTATGSETTHKYEAVGFYTVKLTVEDSSGLSGSTTHVETVYTQPAVETRAASALRQATATLNGTVDPNAGEVTECKFEYGEKTVGESSAPCSALPGSGTSPVEVSALVTGLTPGRAYRYRVVAKNGAGPGEGKEEQFETLQPDRPSVETMAATSLGQGAATLNAQVDPKGGEVTSCEFEYGPTASYGSAVPCGALPGSGVSPVAVSATLSGLSAGSVYHYRISAKNPIGTATGEDETFSTLASMARPLPIVGLPEILVAPAESSFTVGAASVDASSGVITLAATVKDAGTFSWLLTFQNGKFGVFASRNAKCKKGFIKLDGKCRPATIVFAKGSKTVAVPGAVTLKIKPSASAMKALRNALKQKKGLPVTMTLAFQSALGGKPVSHTQTLLVKLKRK